MGEAEDISPQQNAASGEQKAKFVGQATRKKEIPCDVKSQSSRTSTRHSQRSSSMASTDAKAYAKAKAARAQLS